MNYFAKCQMVKEEILSSSLLLVGRKAFMEEIEPFAFGGTANLYRIGILSSGLYVALRTFRPDMPEGQRDLEGQIDYLERYCQNAEELDAEGQEVSTFCVGVIYGQRAGILTEDLTANDTQLFEHHPDNDFALVGETKRRVFVDIDHLFRRKYGKINRRYFLEGNCILL